MTILPRSSAQCAQTRSLSVAIFHTTCSSLQRSAFCIVSSFAFLSFLPGCRLQVARGVERLDFLPLLELEASAIEHEKFHDGRTGQHALLQVAILLAVQILRALLIHVVRHVLGEVREVRLEVAGVRIDDIIDQEGQKLLL